MPDSNGGSFGSIEDLLSYLSAVESTVENEVERIADSLDAVTDRISASLRSAIGDSAWFPQTKPSRPPPPPALSARHTGYFEASRDWISRHRAVTAAVVCFLSTGAFLVWRQRRANRAKRRAKRAKNGQRTEIVVLAGPPSAPITRSLSLDLERRGFIVYIPVNSLVEERLIQAESKADIHPLHLDVTSPSSLSNTIRKFTALFEASNAPKYPLHLTSFILLPQTPSAPQPQSIAHTSAESWSDALTTHLLSPFTLLQAFIPLISSHKASILFLSPVNTPSLSPPQHALENVVAGGMERYIFTLRKEMAASRDMKIIQFKLGAFDDASDRDAFKMALALRHDNNGAGSDTTSPLEIEQKRTRGTPLRDLHLKVFDAIVGKRTGAVYVGRGARVYDTLGKAMPDGLVKWMLGLQIKGKEAQKQDNGGDRVYGGGSSEWEKVDPISGDESA
ncbi:MAG: hypothetical protein LQ338_008289 [Usnochroma carphineum]|nr:MAG: hypothetical protein LQ338_008289 [Usnochroma carphineum]